MVEVGMVFFRLQALYIKVSVSFAPCVRTPVLTDKQPFAFDGHVVSILWGSKQFKVCTIDFVQGPK